MLFGVLLFLGVLEGILRLMPAPRYAANWLYHPVLGHMGPQNEVVHYGANPAVYNWLGLRGGMKWVTNHGNFDKRIVVLGDSITEAIEMPWPFTYVQQLGSIMTAQSGLEYDVVNLSKNDFGTTQLALAYDILGRQYKPDILLLQFLGLNDFVNNALAFSGENQAASDFVRPYIIPDGGREQEFFRYGDMRITFAEPWRKVWRDRSRLFHFLESVWVNRTDFKQKAYGSRSMQSRRCKVEAEVFLQNARRSPAWQQAFTATKKAARHLQKLAGQSRFLAVYFPSEFEASDRKFQESIAMALENCHPERRYDRRAAEKMFTAIFTDLGVEVYSLTETFRQATAAGAELYLPGGHLNIKGHRLAAETIAGYLRSVSPRVQRH